jgi:hypothetical protein
MDLDLWFRLILKYDIQKIVKTDKIVSNFRRHEEAKSTINQQFGDFENSFFYEQLMIFDCFIPNNNYYSSYFNLLKIDQLKYLEDLQFNLTDELKKMISEEYLYKLIKKSFYLKKNDLCRKFIKVYFKINFTKYTKDINYFSKQIIINQLLFWK